MTFDVRLPDPIPVTEAGTVRQLIEVDPRNKALKDVVGWLDGVPLHAEVDDPRAEPAVMGVQAGKSVSIGFHRPLSRTVIGLEARWCGIGHRGV